MKRKSGIYCITNIQNQKCYIGSSKNLYSRKYSHFNKLKANKHCNVYLQRAYNKYGENNFVFYVLELCDIKQLKLQEIHWMNLFQSFLPKKGYNLMLPNKDYISHSKKTREKMSTNSKGKNQKPILQYSLEGILLKEWDSSKEACLYLNCDTSSLCHALKKQRKSKGFYWRYKHETTSQIDNIIPLEKFTRKGTSVICCNDKEHFIFSSINEASKFIKVVPSSIFRAMRDKRKIKNFYIQRYEPVELVNQR